MKITLIVAVTVGSISCMLVSCSTASALKKSQLTEAPAGSAESVLKQMGRVYASIKSYADSGVVYYSRNGVRDESSISFRIHYLRPDHLRFEMTDNIGSPYQPEVYSVLWSYGNATYNQTS